MAGTHNVNEKELKDIKIVEHQSKSKAETEEAIPTEKSPLEHEKKNNRTCLKTFYVILGILAVMIAVALIIVTILTSIATKAYDADQSSRIASMVLLTMTAAFVICLVIYMEVATFKHHLKPMYGSATIILILAIVQALISGIAVNVQPADEAKLLKSLTDSFKLAKDNAPRHYKLWSLTQYDLSCCGVYGPEDYRTQYQPYYFPPNVPISCCPAYDPNRSDLVQEKEREICKAKKNYYNTGCKDFVLVVLNETANIVLTVTSLLITVEVLLLIAASILYKAQKKISHHNKVSQSPT